MRFGATRRLGQNFLVDAGAAARIVAALEAPPEAPVLEIGPGHGALTSALLGRFERVLAVEVDRHLAARLRRRAGPRLLLVEGDFLRQDWTELAAALGAPAEQPLVVVGNLPYSISKPVALRLVEERRRVAEAVLTFQREVVDRLAASPGSRAFGPLGVLAGRAFEIRRLFDLSPAAFRPRPRVLSSVTHWRPRPVADLPAALEAPLKRCLAASFARRRRTLLGNLRAALPGGEREARALLEAAAIDGGLRPEAVPAEGYLRLAALWGSRGALL